MKRIRSLISDRIFFNTILLSLGSVLEKGFSFLTIPLLTRYLTLDEYGELSLVYTYSTFFTILLYNGLQSSFFQIFTSRPYSREIKTIYELLIFITVSFIGVLLILSLVALKTFNCFSVVFSTNYELTMTVFVSLIVQVPYSLKSTIWLKEKKTYFNTVFQFLRGLAIFIACYTLLKVNSESNLMVKPRSELIITALLVLPILITYLFTIRKIDILTVLKEKTRFFKTLIKKSFVYGWKIQLIQLVFIILLGIDRIIVDSILSKSELAIYSIGMTGMLAMFVVQAFNNSYSLEFNSAIMNKKNWDEIVAKQNIYLKKGFLLYVISKVLVYILAPLLINVIAGPDYKNSVYILRLTPDLLILYFGYYTYSRYFIFIEKKLKWLLIVGLITIVLNVIFSVYLLNIFGIKGVLYGSFISLSLMVITILNKYFKEINFQSNWQLITAGYFIIIVSINLILK